MAARVAHREAQGGGGGYRPPGAPPPGGYGSPGGYGPPGGHGGGGFSPAPPPSGPPPGGPKPITGSPQTMALHAMTIDPRTGLPKGEKPPASTAAVVSLVCGVLMCLGPLTGLPAIIAGIIARRAVTRDPTGTGGGGMALAGILLGILNLLGSGIALLIALFNALS